LALPKDGSRWRDAIVRALLAEGRIEDVNGTLRPAGRRAPLADADARLLARVEALLVDGAQPPSIGDIAKALKLPLQKLRPLFERVAPERRLVVVSETRVFTRGQVGRYVATARALAARAPTGFSVRDFRDESGIGRNLVVEILEFFDARGFTRRYGDLRRIVGDDPLQPPRSSR
jgi:selenocysteine-specific elongation factor